MTVGRISRRQLLQGGAASVIAWQSGWTVASGSTSFSNREIKPTKTYARPAMPVLYRRAQPLTSRGVRYPGFAPGTTVLRKDYVRRIGARRLLCDILMERDVAIRMRDGTVIYADILRTTDDAPVPAILTMSPYGKDFGGVWLDDFPDRAGVPLNEVSELQKFECPDPAYWVAQGYAVVNPDVRGAFASGGNVSAWGRQTAEDGYDLVEWCASQDWCTGKVGMGGNSWHAISQWFVASEHPPHLTCIAPWEGLTDAYRDQMARGGIPVPALRDAVLQTLGGHGLVEDIAAMIVQNPLFDDYWDDKVARLERIEVPAYVLASYTNGAHAHGGFEGFRRISSRQKWLRVHNTHEWPDLYNPESVEDLRRFFDHFLKRNDNGWDETPKIRLSILDPGPHFDIVNQAETAFPVDRAVHRPIYLGNDGATLSFERSDEAQMLHYASETDAPLTFRMPFDRVTDVIGYMNLYLWASTDTGDDMDLEATVFKTGVDGKSVFESKSFSMFLNKIVATGRLRASLRARDPARSTPSEPFFPFTKEERLTPGEMVALQIPLWPMGMRFHPGEALTLTVGAFRPFGRLDSHMGRARIPVPIGAHVFDPDNPPAMRELGGEPDPIAAHYAVDTPATRNRGIHSIAVGGEKASFLLVPMIEDPMAQ